MKCHDGIFIHTGTFTLLKSSGKSTISSTASIMLNISKHLSTYDFLSSPVRLICFQTNRYVLSSCTTRGLGVPSHCIRCFQSSSSRYMRSCSYFFRDNSANMAHVGFNRCSRSCNNYQYYIINVFVVFYLSKYQIIYNVKPILSTP